MPSLQTRSKWTKHSGELKPGDLVQIFEDYAACGRRPVVQAKSVTKGKDNVARSWEIITSCGIVQRLKDLS